MRIKKNQRYVVSFYEIEINKKHNGEFLKGTLRDNIDIAIDYVIKRDCLFQKATDVATKKEALSIAKKGVKDTVRTLSGCTSSRINCLVAWIEIEQRNGDGWETVDSADFIVPHCKF